VLMITAGYMGAVSVVTTVKWFWFLFGMAMFLPVIYSLARTFRETVITRKDPEMIELYGKVAALFFPRFSCRYLLPSVLLACVLTLRRVNQIAWLTIIMWSFYPVVWLFSEGFASFSVSFEVRMCLVSQGLGSLECLPVRASVIAAVEGPSARGRSRVGDKSARAGGVAEGCRGGADATAFDWRAGCCLHHPRHHLEGGVLLHDRVGTRFPGLDQHGACSEPRVRLKRPARARGKSARRADGIRGWGLAVLSPSMEFASTGSVRLRALSYGCVGRHGGEFLQGNGLRHLTVLQDLGNGTACAFRVGKSALERPL